MFIKGVLSIFQILLFPGLLIVQFRKRHKYFLVELGITIALSLIFNLFAVLLFISLHIYTYVTLIALLCVEFILLVLFFRGKLFQSFWTNFLLILEPYKEKFIDFFKIKGDIRPIQIIQLIIRIAVFGAACYSLIFVFIGFINNIGSVFNSWDAIVSYNRWATEWSKGLFPTGACEYPQLLPINWSITYVLTQSNIVVFAKMIQGVFPVFMFILLFDLALSYKSIGLMASLLVLKAILIKFTGNVDMMFDGYMETAVATMIFFAFYIILIDYQNGEYSEKTIWNSAIIISAAAIIKQPGLFAFGGWILTNFLLIFSVKKNFRLTMKSIWLPLLFSTTIIGAWYIYSAINNIIRTEPSCLAISNSLAVQDLNNNFFQLMIFRLNQLGPFIILIPILFLSFLVKNRAYRIIQFTFVFPFLFLCFFYGGAGGFLRYLIPISIFLVIGLGLSIDLLFKFLANFLNSRKLILYKIRKFEKIVTAKLRFIVKVTKRIPVWVVIATLLLLIGLVWIKFPDNKIIRNYLHRQSQIFDKDLDSELYSFYSHKNPYELTLTWYPFINYLPGLENRAVIYYYADIVTFKQQLLNPKIRYLFFPEIIDSEVYKYIFEKVRNGDYEIVFTVREWTTYTMVQILNK